MEIASQGELGKYRLIAELARGGMGIVYLAAVTGPSGFHKTLVVKELKPDLARDEAFLGMFLDEARVAARLHHPNIVQTNEVGEEGGRHFIAMEYLEGCTLRRAARELGKELTLAMHVRVLSEVLRGLHHAHELADLDGKSLRLVHRDVNPHNVFLTFDGQVKILDFGIAKTLDSSQSTEAGTFKGKVAYMAPEQASGDPPPDHRADVYACGVMLWEAVAGRRLWESMQDIHILSRLVRKDIPKLEDVKPDAPAALRRMCARAMAYEREERFATAAEFEAELERYMKATRTASARDIGALLAKALEPERTRMKALVDRKLAQLKSGDISSRIISILPPSSSTSGIPRIELDDDGSDDDEPRRARERPGTSEEPPRPGDRPRTERTAGEVDAGGATPATLTDRRREAAQEQDALAAVAPPPAEPSSLTQTNSAAPIVAPDDDLEALAVPPRSRFATLLAFAAAAALIGIGAYFALRRDPAPSPRPEKADAPVAARGGAGQIPPPEPPVDSVVVTVRATPAAAAVTLDKEPPAASPLVRRFPRGKETHVVRASAQGFVPKAQEFSPDKDLFIELSLIPIATRPMGAPPVRPATATTATTAAAPSAGARPIETSSPYAPSTH